MYEKLEAIYIHSKRVISDYKEKVLVLDEKRELYKAFKSIIRIAENYQAFFNSDEYDKNNLNQKTIDFLKNYNQKQNELNLQIGTIWNDTEAHLSKHGTWEQEYYSELKDYLLYDTPQDLIREFEGEY